MNLLQKFYLDACAIKRKCGLDLRGRNNLLTVSGTYRPIWQGIRVHPTRRFNGFYLPRIQNYIKKENIRLQRQENGVRKERTKALYF